MIEKSEKNILINSGIYFIDVKIKKFIKNSEYLDMTDLINRAIKKKIKINVFPVHETWLDYGLKKIFLKKKIKKLKMKFHALICARVDLKELKTKI